MTAIGRFLFMSLTAEIDLRAFGGEKTRPMQSHFGYKNAKKSKKRPQQNLFSVLLRSDW